MSETTTATTVTLDEELAYDQLVTFQQGVVDYNKAQDEDDTQGMLDAANNVIQGFMPLINDLIKGELSDKLHARLAEEHPDLVPDEPSYIDLNELMAQLMGGNLPEGFFDQPEAEDEK